MKSFLRSLFRYFRKQGTTEIPPSFICEQITSYFERKLPRFSIRSLDDGTLFAQWINPEREELWRVSARKLTEMLDKLMHGERSYLESKNTRRYFESKLSPVRILSRCDGRFIVRHKQWSYCSPRIREALDVAAIWNRRVLKPRMVFKSI